MSELNTSDKKKIDKSSLCPNCGAILPKGASRCLICGTSRNKKPVSQKKTSTETSLEPITPSNSRSIQKNRRFIRSVAFLLFIVFLASGLGAGAFEYLSFQHLKSQFNSTDAVIYQQDAKNLKIKLSSFEEPITIKTDFKNITEDLLVKNSFDNRFIAYLDEQDYSPNGYEGKLHLLDLTKLNDDEKELEELIISDDTIMDFFFSPKDDLIAFVTSKGELYQCNYNNVSSFFKDNSIDNTLIDSDVKGIIGISGDQILYYKGEDATPNTLDKNRKNYAAANNIDLYTALISEEHSEPLLVSTNVTDVIATAKDYTKILYAKVTEKAPHTKFNVHSFNQGAEETNILLVENISRLVDYNIASQELVYLTESEKILTFDTLFTDSMLEEDDTSSTPFIDNAEGDDAETSEEVELSEEELEAQEDLENQKNTRDKLRSKLKYSLRHFKDENPTCYALHYNNYLKETDKIISENLYNISDIETLSNSNLDNGYIFYVDSDIANLQAEDIATWEDEYIEEVLSGSLFDIKEYIADHAPETLNLYSVRNESSNKIYSESGNKVIYTYFFEPETNEIFFISKPSYKSISGTLYSGFVNNGFVDKIPYIDEYVSYCFGVVGKQRSNTVYQTSSNDNPPEHIIYIQTMSGIAEIAAKTAGPETVNIVDKDAELILFYRNYENFPKQGDLYLYNTEEILLSDNVHQYIYYAIDDMIFFQYNKTQDFQMTEFKDGTKNILDSNINAYHSFSESLSPVVTN